MDFNRWWETDPEEIYWLEITDRKDLGDDLNAPQLRDDGQEYYGYSLIREVRDRDVVFHYHKDLKAIVAWSLATGIVWADKVFWGAHGTVARNAGVHPYVRDGWRLGLRGIQPIEPSVSLDELRAHQENIQAIRVKLQQTYQKPVYFPFEPPDRRDLRPTQAYITKLPAEVLTLIPALSRAALEARRARARIA